MIDGREEEEELALTERRLTFHHCVPSIRTDAGGDGSTENPRGQIYYFLYTQSQCSERVKSCNTFFLLKMIMKKEEEEAETRLLPRAGNVRISCEDFILVSHDYYNYYHYR